LVTSVVGGEVVKHLGFVPFGGQAELPGGLQAGAPYELGDDDQVGPAAQTGLVANVCLRTWAAGLSSSAAGFGYRDQHHLPLARLEVELHLAQDRAGTRWPSPGRRSTASPARQPAIRLAAAGGERPGLRRGHRVGAAAADHGLAERARHLLDRLRAYCS
jgi:hypothetical protein